MPQPSMEITVPRQNSLYDFYGSFHYVPRGQHDFGVISIFNHIILPVKFDTTGLGYNRVKYTIQVRQEGIIPVTDRQTHSFSPQWSPTKSEFHFLLPLQVDTVNRTPSMPIFMSLTFPDGKQTNKPDIDITDLIKLCGPGDTLEIKF